MFLEDSCKCYSHCNNGDIFLHDNLAVSSACLATLSISFLAKTQQASYFTTCLETTLSWLTTQPVPSHCCSVSLIHPSVCLCTIFGLPFLRTILLFLQCLPLLFIVYACMECLTELYCFQPSHNMQWEGVALAATPRFVTTRNRSRKHVGKWQLQLVICENGDINQENGHRRCEVSYRACSLPQHAIHATDHKSPYAIHSIVTHTPRLYDFRHGLFISGTLVDPHEARGQCISVKISHENIFT